jgi:large subunit ribosomal protein L21
MWYYKTLRLSPMEGMKRSQSQEKGMYAVVQVGGKQYRVEQGSVLDVEKMPVGDGGVVTLDNVLLVSDGTIVKVGKPSLEGVKVVCQAGPLFKDKKKISYKYRRRKDSSVKRGHRQNLLRLKVKEIMA